MEARWLEKLGNVLRTALPTMPGGRLFRPSRAKSVETDRSSDGWYLRVGDIESQDASLYLFIDNIGGDARRALWYGASAEAQPQITVIEKAGEARWPRTQKSNLSVLPAQFRHEDPWLQRYGSDEWYYGWVLEDDPDTTVDPPRLLGEFVADRFSTLLFELAVEETRRPLTRQLDDLDDLDSPQIVKARKEQAQIRKFLFKGESTFECAICGREFPVDLLIAAHVKRRAECNLRERKDIANNVMPLCTFGCDDLFERGYLALKAGLVIDGPRKPVTAVVSARVAKLRGRKYLRWTKAKELYFEAHRSFLGHQGGTGD